MKKKKKRGLSRILSALLGFACALILGALFYGTMVYQLAGEAGAKAVMQAPAPVPLDLGKSAGELFPGPLLSLDAQLIDERAQDEMYGGESCRVVSRTYDVGGVKATAISAYPAVSLEKLAAEGFVPQLVTGFSLAGLDAVYERRGETGVLATQNGQLAYFLEAQADDQMLYTLGADAFLE